MVVGAVANLDTIGYSHSIVGCLSYLTKEDSMITCEYCKRRNKNDAEFCSGCGAPTGDGRLYLDALTVGMSPTITSSCLPDERVINKGLFDYVEEPAPKKWYNK